MCNSCKNKMCEIPEGVYPHRGREAIMCCKQGEVIVDYCDYCKDYERNEQNEK